MFFDRTLQKNTGYLDCGTNCSTKHQSFVAGGFTLIETFVAITILLLSVAGPLSIASKGIVSSMFARDQVIAFHLAREAVELIRNQRDENKMNGVTWMNGLDGVNGCFAADGCRVSASTGNFSACSGSCGVLQINESSGVYDYNSGIGWKDTIFLRTIKMSQINSDEVSLAVEISWQTGVLSRTFTIRENFKNWQ